jgi:hypothetical protein
MRRLEFAALGALAGSAICCTRLPAGSHQLLLAGIQLYESESGQPRNFNLFLQASPQSAAAVCR